MSIIWLSQSKILKITQLMLQEKNTKKNVTQFL